MSTNRQKWLLRYAITPLLLLCPLIAHAKLNVVATLPDFGSLAREIGNDKIDLVVLGKPSHSHAISRVDDSSSGERTRLAC